MVEVRRGAATLCVVLSATSLARAQQDSVAESLFRRAREEMKLGDPAAACPKFEESYRLDPSLGTLLNLALCEDALGHTATAWTKLREFLDSAPAGDNRVSLAREKSEKLEAELPRLRLLVDAEDEQSAVQLDGVELRNVSLSQAIPVNPGEHVVRVTRSTGESNESTFRIQRAERLDLRIAAPARKVPVAPPGKSSLLRVPVGRESPGGAVTVTNRVSESRNGERALAYGLGAVGVTGLALSGVFGLMALHDRNTVRDQCPNHECRTEAGFRATEAGARRETVANVAFAVGALGLVTGGVLFWHSQRASAAVSVNLQSASVSWVATIQ